MYVGYRKQDYYGPVFRRLKEYDQGTFNFSAFFFSIYWLFYRKMYIEGLVAWGIGSGVKSIIVNILAAITKPTNIGNWFNDWFEWRIMLSKIAEISDTIIGVLVAIIIGCIGNRLYFKKIERLKRKSKPYKAGGTSILFAIIIPLGVTILLTLLEVLIDKL